MWIIIVQFYFIETEHKYTKSAEFIVPDYYKDFSCKCSSCRSICCQGWGISVSYEEYNRLIGLPCSKKLRARLDRAFVICDHPYQERYALVAPDSDGRCPLLMANGYCMLHADRGPCSLPKICKLYPRAIRKGYIPECVCSCSCEKVVELLISSTAPLTFSSEQITIDPSDIPTCSYVLEGYKRDILYHCIGIMEDRSLKIKDRIIEIGKYITDKTGVQLEMYPDIFCFSSFSYSFIYAIKLISILGNVSRELKAYGFMCLKYLGVNTDKLDEYTIPDQTELEYASHKYTEALSHLETVLPDYPLYFEKILVNHMFYENFPFSDPKESPANTFVSFCAVYSLIKLTTACYMNDKSEKDDFTDSVSGIMHFIEHTSFYMNAEVIFRSFCVSSKVLINSLSDI